VARTVAIVPHTHWDREWYASFQSFRLRLVDLLDDFLPALEADPSYARFLLDGQMAVVDDYLAVRPEAEDRIRRLRASGRLAMGPWYILMDEFLVSGETMVRNLQRGLERATAFGGAMPVGYLPDMFGHVAQMPQLLRQAGFEHAVVWRGVPGSIDNTAFSWSAPDGSTVRAEYLRHGYGNGAAIPDDAKALLRRIRDHEAELGANLADDAPILWMNGTDHQVPQFWLGRVVAEVNDIQDDYHLVIQSLAEYVAGAARATEALPAWTGELRSSARANLLMGVTSNRVDVKQAAARVERNLERRAEPLCALFMAPGKWPGALLDVAWMEVIRNSAHDSICACSIDQVGVAVLHRYGEADEIATGLARRAVEHLGRSMAEAGPVIVNPSARTRGGLVELQLPGDGAGDTGDGTGDETDGAQVLSTRAASQGDLAITGADLGAILGEIRSQQIGDDTFINAIEVEETDDGLSIVLHADARLRTELMVEEIKRDLYARVGARPDMTVRVRTQQPPSRQVLAWVDAVPGFGWQRWRAAPPTVPPVTADGATMSNGAVTVVVDAHDGTFAVNGLAGLDRLVDDGDQGDTYNYSPPARDTVVDGPDAVTVDVLESGPLRAKLAVTRTFVWPERIDDTERSRVGECHVVVRTELELRAGDDFVRVHTCFDNPARDHRLRAWFPLPEAATASQAECAFAIVERGLEAEGGPGERGLPTFPSRRFVRAGGLTIAHEGLLEYELVDGGRALALTLLRATGWLSRVEMSYRPLPAGPPIRLEGPQLIGSVEARYAVHVGDRDPYAVVDDAFLPLEVAVADGGGDREDEGSAFAISGAEVSALRRVAGGYEVRVFNPSATSTTVDLPGRSGWLVDLRGRPVEPFDGSFELGPWRIATARVPA
jgi:alpha-mannosidase